MNKEELKTFVYDEIAKCNRCGSVWHIVRSMQLRKRVGTPRGKNASSEQSSRAKSDNT